MPAIENFPTSARSSPRLKTSGTGAPAFWSKSNTPSDPLTSTSLTALIHTLNEVDQIEACIRSVEFADEIYLLDSFSTDGTVELVRERFPQVRIEQRTSLGSAAQKNYGMDHAANEWILVVDADERVTPELRTEIQTLLGAPDRWAYSIGRRNFVFGTELHYSGLQHDR